MASEKTIREEIMAVLADYCVDYNNKRFDLIPSKYYDPEVQLVGPGGRISKFDELSTTLAEYYTAGLKNMEIVVDQMFITDHLVPVHDHGVFHDEAGNPTQVTRCMVVFKKHNDKWLICFGIIIIEE